MLRTIQMQHVRATQRQSRDVSAILRWLQWALAAAVVVPAIFFIGTGWSDHERLLAEATTDTQRTVAVLREHAINAIQINELLVRELDLRTKNLTWDEIRSQSGALSEEAWRMQEDQPQVAALALADSDGKQWVASLARNRPVQSTTSVASREFFLAQRQADQGTYISRSYIGGRTNQLNFGISRRRTSADGAFNGTVHVAVATRYFTDFWSSVVAGHANAVIALIRDDGEMLARTPTLDAPLPRLTADNSLMRDIRAHPLAGVDRLASPIDHSEHIYAYAKVGRYPLVISYGIATADVLVVWKAHLAELGAACLLAAAALAFAILVAMRQTQRLAREQAHRMAAEAAARQAQRLELLGQLVAGVAHDFGNLIQAVVSGTRLIEKSDDLGRIKMLAASVREAGERGSALTRRMLGFARMDDVGGTDTPAMVNPAEAVSEVCDLIARTLDQTHSLQCHVEKRGLPRLVRGGRPGLESVILNLAANARDAMPGGGQVIVWVAAEQVVMTHVSGLKVGLYARVSVADTGVGMPSEVLARAGDAFFTTKPRGKGTGLGLSGARGYAEQAGGALHVDSELGRGTTVTFWLPAVCPDAKTVGDDATAGTQGGNLDTVNDGAITQRV